MDTQNGFIQVGTPWRVKETRVYVSNNGFQEASLLFLFLICDSDQRRLSNQLGWL